MEIKTLFQSPVFSFGNFCYHLQKEEGETYQSQTLEFVIQKKMLELSPWKQEAESLPIQKGSRCLYTVKTSPGHAAWDLSDMEQYAKENGLSCEKSHMLSLYTVCSRKRQYRTITKYTFL